MKTYIFNRIVPLVLLLAPACDTSDETPRTDPDPDGGKPDIEVGDRLTLSPHFVGEYIDVTQITLRSFGENNTTASPATQFRLPLEFSYEASCCAPEWSAQLPWSESRKAQNDARFLELARRYADLAYTGGWLLAQRHRCSSEPFLSLHAVCRNRALDENHPAGSSLDDIMRVTLTSYGDFIRGGYAPLPLVLPDLTEERVEFSVLDKALADLTAEDLTLFDVFNDPPEIYLEESYTPREKGVYAFVVTLTALSGKTYTAEHTLRIE